MNLEEQDIKVYSNEHGYSTRLSKLDQNGEWMSTFLFIHFKKGIEVPNKASIHVKKAWISFYQNKNDKTVLYLFISDFDFLEVQE